MKKAHPNNIPDQPEFLRLKNVIATKFLEEQWLELGMITNCLDLVQGHDRLLRSLAWNDSDYPGNVLNVLLSMCEHDKGNFHKIKEYVDARFPDGNETSVSSKPAAKKITFAPSVFEVPAVPMDDNLVSVMMPFESSFKPVYEAIKDACAAAGFSCKRADDIWVDSILVQDIFSLIYISKIVISDFSGRNPNVLYETGIAHTLGRIVVPITRNGDDTPFDLRHHRHLAYLPNGEGLKSLTDDLTKRLNTLKTS